MRYQFLALSLILAVVPGASSAAPPKTKTAGEVPASKSDPALVVRSLQTKELAASIQPADRKTIDAVIAELKADRPEGAIGLLRGWKAKSAGRVAPDDMTGAALFAFREGLLLRRPDLENAADRLRFLDERYVALADAVGQLRGAAAANRPLIFLRLVVLSPYAKGIRGDDKREARIVREEYDIRIRELDTLQENTRKDRDSVREAFRGLGDDAQRAMSVLAGLLGAVR